MKFILYKVLLGDGFVPFVCTNGPTTDDVISCCVLDDAYSVTGGKGTSVVGDDSIAGIEMCDVTGSSVLNVGLISRDSDPLKYTTGEDGVSVTREVETATVEHLSTEQLTAL